MTFAQKLLAHRKLLQINQAAAAAILEISTRTFWTWESGSSIPYAVTQEGALARLENAGSTATKPQ